MLEPGRLQGKRHSDRLEGILVVLVRQGAAGDPQGDRHSASTASASRWASTPPTRSTRSYTFMDAYNVKLVDDNGKLLVDDPKVQAGPDRRADRLHRRRTQGLHAALLHQLEGPGQQRRLPQQDDRDDAQRDDLDRREVARRLPTTSADAGSSAPPARRPMRSTSRPPASRTSRTARR